MSEISIEFYVRDSRHPFNGINFLYCTRYIDTNFLLFFPPRPPKSLGIVYLIIKYEIITLVMFFSMLIITYKGGWFSKCHTIMHTWNICWYSHCLSFIPSSIISLTHRKASRSFLIGSFRLQGSLFFTKKKTIKSLNIS